MKEENKIVYGDYEITYTNNDIEVKDCGTGKIYCSKFKVFKVIEQLQNNWNELKEFVEKNVKRWEQEEQKWIEQGFMKFGGEANNKIIFKKVLSKMQEIESRNNDSNNRRK